MFNARLNLMLFVATAVCVAQTAEISSKDAPVTFKSGVNLVPVTVVVRDSKGHALGNLSAEDFQLFDNGKPQMISKFTVEKLASGTVTANVPAVPPPTQVSGSEPATADPDGIPDRFVAYLFDDLHMSASDLHYTRDAALRQIDQSLHGLDRAAIYTTSGHQTQEFTSDRAKLRAALDGMMTGQASAAKSMEQNTCPPVTYYMADLIANRHDYAALKIVAQDTEACLNITDGGFDPVMCESPPPNNPTAAMSQYCDAVRMAKSTSSLVAQLGDRDTESTLETLRAVVSRMMSAPGQRTLVLVSPGFLVTDDRLEEETVLIDRAIKANVVIGSLDARGLYTVSPGGDASQGRVNTATMTAKISYQYSEAMAQADVMEILSSGTGGAFYENSNDLDAGFARVAAAPEYLYVLGFSPTDLKLDGHYHSLKVALKGVKGMDVEARKGYYAPRYAATPAEQFKEQIEEAFFSREEMHDLPAALLTQYFKSDNGDATLSTVAKIDVKKLAFHKEGDRNSNDVTVVTGLFDNDGNYVTGEQKTVEMRLLDRTLDNRLVSGISVESSFTVHPGKYVVRMVVRDTEGQTMAAQSRLVEIP